MKNIRIIPRLDIKGPHVVKPVQTEALRIIGDPKVLAQRYYTQGADELLYLDIVASLYGRTIDFDLLKTVTEDIFIPVTVGGGIRTKQDITNALRAGADKVAINTHAIHHPEFITEAAREFGSQCIVVYIEAKRRPDGTYEAYTDGGRERSGVEVIAWAKRAVELGVGEILITSIDKDGTREGFELGLISAITTWAPTPVIVHGGAANPQTIADVVSTGHADAVAISSIIHYEEYTISQIKDYLYNQGISVRL